MFERSDAASVYAGAAQLAEKLRTASSKDDQDWRVFNVLHRVRCTVQSRGVQLQCENAFSSMLRK
jgi:hypothetical protein